MTAPSTTTKKASVSTSETTEWPHDNWWHRVYLCDYILEKINADTFVVDRNTKNNRARYGKCVSQSEYEAFQHQYLKDGGDPNQVDQQIARECGWELRWARIVPRALKTA